MMMILLIPDSDSQYYYDPLIIFYSIFFLLVVIIMINYFQRNYASVKHQQQLKLPPGPRKLPFIGNLHQVAGLQRPHRRLTELARQYGPLMHLKMGELSVIVVSDAKTAEEMLKTQDVNVAQRPKLVVYQNFSNDNSSIVLAPYGIIGTRCAKSLSLSFYVLNGSIRENEARNIIEKISSACSSSSTTVNLSQKMDSYAHSTFYKSVLGEDINPNHLEELTLLQRQAAELLGGFYVSEIYPSIRMFRHILSVKTKMHLLCDKINNIMDDILTTHRNKMDSKNQNNNHSSTTEDLVDVFLRIQESNDLGIHVTTSNIKGIIVDLFVAGVETSSVTLEWAMSELLKNPAAMNKAQNEVREALHLKGKKQIEESDVEGLRYLKLVIKETFRLHPPGPIIPREVIQNFKINGYDVPVETSIAINFWAIGRNPKYWTNPEKFDPERFIDSPVNFNGSYFQFVPFGSGKRICPGITFANSSMELLLAALLYHFDWKLPNGQNPQELDMDESFGKIVKRQNELCVIATKVH